MICPTTGSIVAYKKIQDGLEPMDKWWHPDNYYLITLEIPDTARRISTINGKCRCEFAKVIEITNIVTEKPRDHVTNLNFTTCAYKVGETVYPDEWDDNPNNEHGHGIYFFMSKQEALDY